MSITRRVCSKGCEGRLRSNSADIKAEGEHGNVTGLCDLRVRETAQLMIPGAGFGGFWCRGFELEIWLTICGFDLVVMVRGEMERKRGLLQILKEL